MTKKASQEAGHMRIRGTTWHRHSINYKHTVLCRAELPQHWLCCYLLLLHGASHIPRLPSPWLMATGASNGANTTGMDPISTLRESEN